MQGEKNEACKQTWQLEDHVWEKHYVVIGLYPMTAKGCKVSGLSGHGSRISESTSVGFGRGTVEERGVADVLQLKSL